MERLYGFLFMFLCACCYGASGIIIKFGYQAGLQAMELLAWQNIISMVCLWAMLLWSCGWRRLSRSQVRRLIVQGLVGNFGISVCYFLAAERMDISLLVIILFSYPALVLLWEMAVERRRVSLFEWLALACGTAGMVLAVNPGNASLAGADRWGLLLAVGAAATYAFMNIYGEKLMTDMPPQVITAYTCTVSTIGVVTVFVPPAQLAAPDFTPLQWLLIFGSAMLSTALPMNLMFAGIKRIGAFYASLVSVAELPLTLIMAYLLLAERMAPLQMGGGVLILASVLILHRYGHKPESGDSSGPVEEM